MTRRMKYRFDICTARG